MSATPSAWAQTRIARKYPLSLPVPPGLLANIPSPDDDEAVQSQLTRYAFLVEFSHILSLVPSGIYVLPDVAEPYIWRCVIMVREGLWRGAASPFRLVFPKDNYPDSPPKVFFDEPLVPHVMIDPKTGELQLPDAFTKEWDSTKYCSLHVLLYVKQIFYDIALIRGTEDSPDQSFRALLLQESKSEALQTVDRAIRISVEHTANLASKGSSSLCPLLIVPECHNSELPLDTHEDDDCSSDVLLTPPRPKKTIVPPLNLGGSSNKLIAPAPPVVLPGPPPRYDYEFTEERLKNIVNAFESFGKPSGRMADPVEAFLEWFTEGYLGSLSVPLHHSNKSPIFF